MTTIIIIENYKIISLLEKIFDTVKSKPIALTGLLQISPYKIP